MSRVRTADNSSAVSLFPFLAVLICTMGSLLVVLIVVTRIERSQAKERAEAKAQSRAPAQPVDAEARRQLEEIERRTQQLKAVRVEAGKKLAQEQLRLRQLEDHMRRLQDQLGALMLAVEELDAMSEEHHDDRAQAEHEIERLKRLIADMHTNIETAKEEAANKKRSYAIVPYVGPNGTHRRPIYIECRGEEVILQPEGVRLTPDDFAPPFGPGNPLAATVRAAREYMVRQQTSAERAADNEPYPLIIVRPNGIGGFHAVRKSVELANLEFGYQFVDGDWELEFPAPNPELANLEERALAIARARQAILAAAAPRVYAARRFAATGDNGSGGLADLGEGGLGDHGLGGLGRAELGDPASLTNVTIGKPDGSVSGSLEIAGNDSGGIGSGMTGRLAAERGRGASATSSSDTPAGDRFALREGAVGREAVDLQEKSTNELSGPYHPGGSASVGNTSGPGGPDQPDPDAISSVNSRNDNDAATSGGPGGPSPIGSESPTAAMAPGAKAGGDKNPAASMLHEPMDESNASALDENRDAQPSNGSASYVVNNAPPQDGMEPPANEPREYVEARGDDWSFRDKNPAAVPIRRSIQIVIREDRVAILPDANQSSTFTTGGKVVEMPGGTAESLGEFGKALRDHVKSWGSAGQGLYWRPVLEFNIGPDGQDRANELAQLLKDSGIELRRASAVTRQQKGAAGATR